MQDHSISKGINEANNSFFGENQGSKEGEKYYPCANFGDHAWESYDEPFKDDTE
jgi:hypothetical protein